jgi:spore coat protein CotF
MVTQQRPSHMSQVMVTQQRPSHMSQVMVKCDFARMISNNMIATIFFLTLNISVHREGTEHIKINKSPTLASF